MADSSSPLNDDSPGSTASNRFVWVDCRSRGWQALMLVENVDKGIPEPPTCVIDSYATATRSGKPVLQHTSPAFPVQPSDGARSPSRRWEPQKPWQPVFGDADIGLSENKPAQPRSPRSMSPRKDFVERNKQVGNRPNRQSKLQMLEEASRQLQESEAIGTSLADRLSHIQHKLTPS